MTRIQFKRWDLDIDIDITRNIYTAMNSVGYAERCSCDPCKNFSAQKDTIYPPVILTFFNQIGIDYRCEIEVAHTAKMKNGNHLYMGWFYCVGQITSESMPGAETDKENPEYERITKGFMLTIDPQSAYEVAAFAGYSVIEIDYCVEIPWIIAATEPT